MAELKDETVVKLNKLLDKLAAASAPSAPDITAGGGTVEFDEASVKRYRAELAKLREDIDDVETSFSGFFDSSEKHFKLASLKIQEDAALVKLAMQDMEEGSPDFNEAKDKLDGFNKELKALGGEESAVKNLEMLGQNMLGLGIKTGGMSEKLVNLGKGFADAKAKGGSFTKILATGFKSLGIAVLLKPLTAFIENTVGLIKAQDAAISSFRKSTGATAEYNYEITQTERRNFAAGVSAADAGRAFEGLFTTFSAFTQLNENQRAALIDTTVNLEKLGVSAQTSGKLFDQAMRGAGMSANEANDLVLDLAGSAKSLGVPMKKMADDFASSFGELSKYGDGAIKVFKGLAVQAKNTGLEVSQLLNITKQFDQFDTAGQAVGRLNAILGGPYLNSIDMLNASEEERIEILRRQVDMAGVQFDALGRFEQQAMASALGMSVEEANRLFRMSKAEYELEAIRQDELQKQAESVQEIGAQIKSAFMALAVDMRPVVEDVIIPMVKGFAALAKFIGGAINKLHTFGKVALFAAGLAALIGAPFTGGASLITYAAIAGTAGMASWGTGGGDSGGAITPRFASGGVVQSSSLSMVGENGPELIEMPVGTRVNSAPATQQLTDAITNLMRKLDSGGTQQAPIQLAVYIGQEKIDEVVVKALGSETGRRALSPYSMV